MMLPIFFITEPFTTIDKIYKNYRICMLYKESQARTTIFFLTISTLKEVIA